MATVKFFKSILEDEYEEITTEKGTRIEDIVRQYGDDNIYQTTMVECYDPDTDETTFVPLVNECDFGLVASVNGKEVSKDYILEEDDQCVLIITPMDLSSGQSKDGKWNWWGALIGTVLGAAAGAITGAMYGGAPGAIAGAILGGVLGFVAGGIAGAQLVNKQITSEKGNQLPDIKGSANQPITGNPIPLVLGQMEVTPFIVASPYVEYSGVGGKKATIRTMYGIGYTPLKLTDIKFDGLVVATNKRTTENKDKIIFTGKLSEPKSLDGDIEVKWISNNVEFEIIQQNQNAKGYYYGDIFPYAKKMTNVDATPMYIKDSMIGDLEENTDVVKELCQYKGQNYDDGFRTNSVRFSEQYPKKVSIVLDLPDGIYRERNEDGETKRQSVPLWMGIQWRPYSKNSFESDTESIKSNANYGYEFSENIQDGWISFDQMIYDTDDNGDPLGYAPEQFEENDRVNDLKEHSGNNLYNVTIQNETNSGVISALSKIKISKKGKLEEPEPFLDGVVTRTVVPGHRDEEPVLRFIHGWGSADVYHFVQPSTSVPAFELEVPAAWWEGCPIDWVTYQFLTIKIDSKGNPKKVIKCWNWPVKDGPTAFGNEGWGVGTRAFNLQKVQNYVTSKNEKKSENQSELRVTFTADIEKFCKDKKLDPKDFLFSDDNTTKAIEVRVVRISPNYMDEEKGSSSGLSKTGPWTYHDTVKWTVMTTETVDPEAIKGNSMPNLRPLPDRKYKDMCLLSMKCDVDSVGNIQNQIGKLSVVAQAFQPVWEPISRKWLPENIINSYKYYTADRKTEITKEQYEQDRQNGILSIRTRAGNNWVNKIDSLIFGKEGNPTSGENVYITEEAYKFLEYGDNLNNSSASAFMNACVGKHLGIDALDYSRIHQLAMGEWFEDCQDVDDGANHIFMGCNGYIYSPIKLEDLLSKIAVSGRAGFTLDDNGKLVAVMDKQVDYPVGVFNNQNALSTSATYDFTEAPSGVMVAFKAEDNGYIEEGLPVMQDNEDYKDPKREMTSTAIDFVTNRGQANSLGRYFLANKIFSKNALSWKCGIEGFSIQFGDVIKVSGDMFLIGQGSGRIAQFIEDENKVYGFVLTDAYEFDGEPGHAIEIMQPEQYGESKVIVVEVNSENGLVKDDGTVVPRQCIGITNSVVFKEPMLKGENHSDTGKKYYFNPKIGNLVTYGLLDRVSGLYRVKSKTPDSKFTYVFNLVPYDERFYNYGAEIPQINNNMTIPSRVTDAEVTYDNTASLTDVINKIKNEVPTMVESETTAIIEDYAPPTKPLFKKATATKDGLIFAVYQEDTTLKNTIEKYSFQIKKRSTDEWKDIETEELYYRFDRDTDGYPEFEGELDQWQFRVKARSTFAKESEWSCADDETGCLISRGFYGTWIPYKPVVNPRTAGRTVSLLISQPERKYVPYEEYGNIRYKIRIKHGTEYFEPSEFNEGSPYESEENYYNPDSKNYRVVDATYSQIMPLKGQNNCSWKISYVLNKKISDHTEYEVAENVTAENYKAGKYYYEENDEYILDESETFTEGRIYYNKNVIEKLEQTGFISYTSPSLWGESDKKGVSLLKEKLRDLNVQFDGDYIVNGSVTRALQRVKIQTSTFIGEDTSEVKPITVLNTQVDHDPSINESTQVFSCLNFTVNNISKDGVVYNYADFYCTPEFAGNPQDTNYFFEVVPFNEAGDSPNVNTNVLVTALATSARDIVNSAITTNKLADDCITNDKIHAGTITADKLSVADLSAICARFGKISSNAITQNDYNMWDLETGEFRIGDNDDNYLHAYQKEDGQYVIELKLDTFQVNTENGRTGFNTGEGLFVTDDKNGLKRTVIKYNGMYVQSRENEGSSKWEDKALVILDENNNIIIGNGDSDSMWKSELDEIKGDKVYHFNKDINDNEGNNGLSLIFNNCTIHQGNTEDVTVIKDNDEGEVSGSVTGSIFKDISDGCHVGFWHRGNTINVCGNRITMSNSTVPVESQDTSDLDFLKLNSDLARTLGLNDISIVQADL